MDGTSQNAFGFVILALPVFLLERVIGVYGDYACGRRLVSHSLAGPLHQPTGQTRLDARGANNSAGRALVSVRPLQDWAFGATHTAQLRRISTLHKSKR